MNTREQKDCQYISRGVHCKRLFFTVNPHKGDISGRVPVAVKLAPSVFF